MFKILSKLFSKSNNNSLQGLVIKPLEKDDSEPNDTLVTELRHLLTDRGVEYSEDADWICELDWEILGGSQLKIKLAAQIGPFFIQTAVREGFPSREAVDFDIERTVLMDDTKKTILFLKKGCEKLIEQLEVKFKNHQHSSSLRE